MQSPSDALTGELAKSTLNRAQRRGHGRQHAEAQQTKASLFRMARRAQSKSDIELAARMSTNDELFSHVSNVPRIDYVFKPLEDLLDEGLRTGDIDALVDGTPLIYSVSDQQFYPIVPALVSMCDVYTKLARGHGWVDATAAVRLLAKKLDIFMPIMPADVDAAKGTIAWMRKQTLTITPNQFSAEMIEIQIRDELAAVR